MQKNKRDDSDDTWICNQLENLIVKYDNYLKSYEDKDELDDYERGEYDELLAVVQSLKELLYETD